MRLLTFAFMLSLLVSAQPCLAETVLTAGLPSFPPFAYPEDADRQGVVDDIYKKLGEAAGIEFEIQYLPYPRVVESMKNGDLDVALIFKNLALQGHVTYIGEVSKSKVLVIPKKGLHLGGYEDLYGLGGIAVIRKANFQRRFDLDARIKKHTVISYAVGLLMMSAGRVDAIVGSRSGLESTSRMLGIDQSTWGDPLFLNHKEWWLHMSNKSKYQHLIPELRKVVSDIFSEDLVYELYASSLEETPEKR